MPCIGWPVLVACAKNSAGRGTSNRPVDWTPRTVADSQALVVLEQDKVKRGDAPMTHRHIGIVATVAKHTEAHFHQ
jgi:hypothetical protein